jgi:uncharacterized protein (DUF1501 family)
MKITILRDKLSRPCFLELSGKAAGYHALASALAACGSGGRNGEQVHPSAALWPGLAKLNLHMGEVLAITTDLRSIFSGLLLKRLGRTDISRYFLILPPPRIYHYYWIKPFDCIVQDKTANRLCT